MARNVFKDAEKQFLIDQALADSPSDLVGGAGHAYTRHREVFKLRGWNHHSRGSVSNLLYRIREGYVAHPQFHPTQVKTSAGKPIARTNGTLDSVWGKYKSRILAAADKMERDVLEAKKDLISSLN